MRTINKQGSSVYLYAFSLQKSRNYLVRQLSDKWTATVRQVADSWRTVVRQLADTIVTGLPRGPSAHKGVCTVK